MSASSTSSLTWLDSRPDETRAVRELLKAFDEKGTLDPLGIGVIRDTIADALFPALSTIQTRARYFLFVPWLFAAVQRDIAAGTVPAAEARGIARKRELELIQALKAGNSDPQGIIGRRAGDGLKRLPSEVYWGGLQTLDIVRTPESASRFIDTWQRTSRRTNSTTDTGDPLGQDGAGDWCLDLPPAPEGLQTRVSFELTEEEALFLAERIETSPATRDSLLAVLLDRPPLPVPSPPPWDLEDLSNWPDGIQRVVVDAGHFSTVMRGVHVVYNRLLVDAIAEDQGVGEAANQSAVAKIDGAEEDWLEAMVRSRAALLNWDRPAFWNWVRDRHARIALTQSFCEAWIEAALEDAEAALYDQAIHRLVRERETRLKHGLARLTSGRARERAEPPYGLEPLSYRWPVAKQIIADINAGRGRA